MPTVDPVAAGFLLVKPVRRPSWMSETLLPDRIISGSTCICPRFPGSYAISWCSETTEQRTEDFDEIGIAPGRRDEAIAWATAGFEKTFGWPSVFYTLDDAREARARFLATSDVVIVGLGLPARYGEEFIAQATPPQNPEGFAPNGKSGWLEAIERGAPLPGSGSALGYELLNLNPQVWQLGCSWLCNGLDEFAEAELDIRPGPVGLLATLEDAIRCCDAIQRPDVGAEAGPWFPWLLVDYR